eukprot:TRINITY_DN4809_c0_g1_i1.p1 TRINITY_DN4809_c0_g1~~TRINITY_DN4809_c0_g1_i1.p1  ORF type:complete len:1504 (+),score=269.06 TRINITY_DN4809_c0_g1_i1:171-4682(+)
MEEKERDEGVLMRKPSLVETQTRITKLRSIANTMIQEEIGGRDDSEEEIYMMNNDEEETGTPKALQYSALCGFSGSDPVRVIVYRLTQTKQFEGAVIVLIFANCVVLAFDDPTSSEEPLYAFYTEIVFSALFTIEMVLKVFAQGFVLHKHSYLRNAWNRMDFAIVCLAWLAFLPGVGNFSAVRIVRVLRPLRSINGIPGLRSIVNALFLSIQGLMNVLMLILFFFTVFGILGVQLFKGLYRNRCLDPSTMEPPGYPSSEGQFCRNSSNTFLGRSCPSHLTCLPFKNPDYGFVNFDHIGYAFLVIFQCVTLEGWTDQLYRVQDLWGHMALLYFVPLIIFGSFFILNLALAVISEKFHWTKDMQSTIEITEALQRIIDEEDKERKVAERPSRWQCMRQAIARVAVHTVFQWIIVIFIFVNTVLLAVEHEGQPKELTLFLNYANLVLTGVFTGEMIVKLVAMGARQYTRDYFNILDGCVVVVSVVELVLASSTSVSVFRALRLLRVFKLMKDFPSLRSLVRVVLKAVSDTGYLNVIIVLYLFIAALVGMQLFGGSFNHKNEEPPRATFDSFYWSLLTVFQILTRDDWMSPMWTAMRETSPAACLYFVGLVLVGDFIILNLFLAILINSFDINMNQEDDDGDDSKEQETAILLAKLQSLDKFSFPQGSTHSSFLAPALSEFSEIVTEDEHDHFEIYVHTSSGEQLGGALAVLATRSLRHKFPFPETNGGYSLRVFSSTNTLRVLLTFVVTHPWFEKFILIIITASSVLLAVEDPNAAPDDNSALEILNIIFTALFIAEMVMKIIAFGLVRGKGAYLRDGWNILDAAVVCISVLALVFANFKIVKVFRTLRALRPLRVVNRNVGLKVVVRALLRTLPGVANVAVVVFLIFLVFAILGVQLFGGKLHYCSDPSIHTEIACVGVDPTFYQLGGNDTLVWRRWRIRDQNFNNILSALLTLFEVSTLELWSKIMYNTIDGTDRGHGPERNASPLVGLYFILFIIIGSFFVLNLFVGVVIFNYNVEKKHMEGRALLSPEQERWIEMQRLLLTFRPIVIMPESKRGLRWVTSSIARSKEFETAVLSVIVINVLIMAVDHHDSNWVDVLNYLDMACSSFFILEAIIKLHAWRTAYFRDTWNRFDFILVIFAMASLTLSSNASWTSTVKLIRVLRMVRLLRSSKGMRVLLETLWYSIPYLSNIFLFLGLVFFIYSTLGVNLFSGVKWGEYLTYHANFDNFGSAMLLLFRTCTGEDWNGIMHDLMVQPPDCTEGVDCGADTWKPPLYFISFLLIAAQVMLNLFIAIILDNFSTTVHVERSKVRMSDLNKFVACWSRFDPHGDLLIATNRFPSLLRMLGQPLGVTSEYSRIELLQKVGKFCIPEHGGVIHFVEVLIPLARFSIGVSLSEIEIKEHEEGWRNHFPDIRALPTLRYRNKRVTLDQYYASTYIGASYRRSVAMREYAVKLAESRCRRALYSKMLRQRSVITQNISFLALFHATCDELYSEGHNSSGLELFV